MRFNFLKNECECKPTQVVYYNKMIIYDVLECNNVFICIMIVNGFGAMKLHFFCVCLFVEGLKIGANDPNWL